jgi:hypothetical protein
MAKFASGKYAYAISDRSGQRYRYKDMRKEWNGLLVGKDEWEPKHPQLGPFRKVIDAEALRNARPDRVEPLDVYVCVPTVEQPAPRPTVVYAKVGSVTVTTT